MLPTILRLEVGRNAEYCLSYAMKALKIPRAISQNGLLEHLNLRFDEKM